MSRAKALAYNFTMQLDNLIKEIDLYKDEANAWKCPPGIYNSAGNLTAHLLGNLNHFIGNGIGNNGFIRQRDLEFSVTDKPLSEFKQEIESCKVMIGETLGSLSDEALDAPYSMEFNGKIHPVATIMLYMLSHLTYHLGQINYLRRIQENV